MSENIKFQSICADYSDKNSLIFDIDDDYNDNYDCVDTCLLCNVLGNIKIILSCIK